MMLLFKAQFLLLECLEDLFGGSLVFFLATKCLIVDVTTTENRTARIAIVESFYALGWLIGLPLGTYVNSHFGSVALYMTGLVLSIITIGFVALCVKDNYHTVHEAHPTGSPTEPQIIKMGCNKGS